ncbi:hypothetical protein [Achromobacter sp. DH1f]|uniref:hypothetical protein n=1 Tax=Achromobacter sp. DH1f TaxID=1397275 RepID=UPI000468540D|nr:hypothetical protein [Achromobacter sp. DH1f]
MMKQRARLARMKRQAGSLLAELGIVLAILAVLAVLGSSKVKADLDDTVAEFTGTYMLSVKGGLDAFLSSTFDDIARGRYDAIRAGTAPGPGGSGRPGYPSFRLERTLGDGSEEFSLSLLDLRRAKNVPSGFPASAPLGNIPLIRVIRSGGATCPGTQCRIDAMAYSSRPLNSGIARFGDSNMIGKFLMSTAGYGMAAQVDNPAELRGATGAFANPVDLGMDGIVGVHALLDTTMYEQFVRIRDSRDPDLQGNLTVAGTTNLNVVNVKGDLGVGDDGAGKHCVEIRPEGRVLVNCEGLLQASRGEFAGGKQTVVDGTVGVTTKGLVDSDGGLRVRGTSVTAVGEDEGLDLKLGTNSGVAIRRQDGTDTRVESTQFDAQKLRLRNASATVRASQPCSAEQLGMMALTTQGGVAYCNDAGTQGTLWMEFLRVATEGDSCGAQTVGGSLAQGTAGTLVCRNGNWRKLSDQYSALTLVASRIVMNGDTVPKPACGNLGSSLIYLVPRAFDSTRPAWEWVAENSGGLWRVRVNAPDWGQTVGNPKLAQAIAQIYCSYAY